jgi:predicted ArsR family transcriptional regulator
MAPTTPVATTSATTPTGSSTTAGSDTNAGATLTPTEFASVVTAITSAFGDPTRREIYLHVHEHPEGVTAAEVATRFDLHANVARHHLDKLAGGGYLDVGRSERSGAGRPSKVYSCAEPEIRVEFPVRHHDVLVTLLGKALSMLSPEQAEQMAEEVGIEYGRAMAASLGDADSGRSFRQSLHAVADALTAHGFAAHAEKFGEDLQIVAENCPFGGAAIEHPVICAVDRGMVKGMLGSLYGATRPATESSLAHGDDVCVTAVDL